MSKIKRLLRHDLPLHFVLLLTNWLPDITFCLRLRGALAALFLGSCGKNLRLGRDITFYNPSQIHVGSDVYIAKGCWFMAGETIMVGDEVLFGPYCVIVSSNHTRLNGSYRFGPANQQPVRIGRGAWIAAHAIIGAGAEVGPGSLVSAQAVVVDQFPADVMLGGQPARVIKTIEQEQSLSPEGSVE